MKLTNILYLILIGICVVSFIYVLDYKYSSTPSFKYSVGDTICMAVPPAVDLIFHAKIDAKFDTDLDPSHMYVLEFLVPFRDLKITTEAIIDQYKVKCE